MNSLAKSFRTGWSALAWLFVATSLYEGYLIIPGLSNHSIFSLLARAFLLLAPAGALLAIARGARRGLVPLAILTAWLIVVGLTYLLVSPHQYYEQYYVWSQLGGYLLVLSLWVLGRHGAWLKAVVMGALPLYLLATIALSLYEVATAHHLAQSREGGLHPTHIPTAFYYDPNNLGVAIALLLPFVVLATMAVPKRWMAAVSGLFALLLLYVLYATGSRGGELALVIDLIVLAFVLPRPYRRYAQVSLAVVAVLLAGAILVLQAIPTSHLPFALQKISHIAHLTRFLHPTGPSSVGIRKALYESGWQGLLTHPWGMGPRGAERYFQYWLTHHSPYNTYGVIDAHNMWLEVAMDFGFEGIALYVAFYVLLIRSAIRLLSATDRFPQYLGSASLAALIGFILGSLSPSSVMIGYNVMWVVYGIVLGGLGTLDNPSDPHPEGRYQFRGRLW